MRYLLLTIILVLSCSSKKEVILIQDAESLQNFDINYQPIKIKSDDILRVKVSSKTPELAKLFSFDEFTNTSSESGFLINGYMVNSDGFINIPLLSPVLVKDLTVFEASEKIQKSLEDQGLLINSTVDVKILNSYFTVLGEVNKPGRYNFIKNNINIFNALGLAGDLTINGNRDDIRILRNFDGNLVTSTVDLTKANLLSSDNFQVFPGDIIIVNPNDARVKNAGIIGNSGNLLSVLSFILSSLILITSSN